jgi:hypothetical protein
MMHDIPNYAENWQDFFKPEERLEIIKHINSKFAHGSFNRIEWESTPDGTKVYTLRNTAGVASKPLDETDMIDITDWLYRNLPKEEATAIDDAIKGKSVEGDFAEKWKNNGVEYTTEKGEIGFSKATPNTGSNLVRLTTNDIKIILDEIISTSDDIGKTMGSMTSMGTDKFASSVLKKRKTDTELDPVIRKLMGEYFSPEINYVKSIAKVAQLYEKSKVELELANQGNGFYFNKKKMSPDWIKIKANDSYILSKQGFYAHPDVYKALFTKPKQTQSTMGNALMAMNGMAKASLTIMKDDSQARNFWGAWMNLIATGNIVMPLGGKSLYDATLTATADFKNQHQIVGQIMSTPLMIAMQGGHIWNNMQGEKSRTKEDFTKQFLEAVEYNLIEQSVEGGIIKDIAERMYDDAVGNANYDSLKKKFSKGFQETMDSFSKPYQATDSIFKIIQWKKEQARFKKAYAYKVEKGEMTKEEFDKFVKKKAAEMVRREQPTYSKTSLAMKALSRQPLIGSFVMFQSQMWKTRGALVGSIYNLQKEARAETNPEAKKELNKMAIRKSAGLLTSLSITPILSAITMAMMDIGGDEDEAISSLLPYYLKNAKRLYLNSDVKNPHYLDLQFIDPSSTFHKPVMALMRGDVGEAVEEIVMPFIGEEIQARAIFEVLWNEDAYGQQIYNPQDSWVSQASKVFGHSTENMIPGFLKSIDKMYKGGTGFVTSYGAKYHLWDEVINSRLGVKAKSKEMDRAYQSKLRSLREEHKEAKKLYTDVFNDINATDSDKKAALKQANYSADAIFEQMRESYVAMEKLGFNKGDIRKLTSNWKPKKGEDKGGYLLSKWLVKAMETNSFNGIDEKGNWIDDVKTKKGSSSELGGGLGGGSL